MTKQQPVQTKDSVMAATDDMYRFGFEAALDDMNDHDFSMPTVELDGEEYTRGYFDALNSNN